MIAAMYGLWLIYASGIINLMLSVVLYARVFWYFSMP